MKTSLVLGHLSFAEDFRDRPGSVGMREPKHQGSRIPRLGVFILTPDSCLLTPFFKACNVHAET